MEKIKEHMLVWVAVINVIISHCFGKMSALLYIVIGLMVLDLLTRLYAAGVRGDEQVESRKIIKGLYRKLGLCILIVLSLILDLGLQLITEGIGLQFTGHILFTDLTLAWLFVREFISNLENLQHAGIELPRFIVRALSKTKQEVEALGQALVEAKKEK